MLFELKGNEFFLQQIWNEKSTLVIVNVKPNLEEEDDRLQWLAVITRGLLGEEWQAALEELEDEEEGPVVAPELDLFFLVSVLQSFVGQLGRDDNGKYGENKALNTHDINNSKNVKIMIL